MYQRPDYERAIELIASGHLHLAELITHRFPFAEYQQAYEAIAAAPGRCLKVLITLD
jgi:L-iditol 2-dehydrogenase